MANERRRRDGVLTGFNARVQPLALGIALQAMVAVQLGHHSGAQVEAFFEGVGSNPAVIAIYDLVGATVVLAHVAVRDTYALRRFVIEVMGTRAEISHGYHEPKAYAAQSTDRASHPLRQQPACGRRGSSARRP